MIETAVYLLASLTLVYSGFCRLVRTDVSTVLCIRVAFWMLTVAASISAAAVLVWGYAPGWPSTVLAASMAAVQLACSVLWQAGVPPAYRNRASDRLAP